MQIDLSNLTLEQKEMILRIGVIKIIESIYEGVPSIERLQKKFILSKTNQVSAMKKFGRLMNFSV